MRHLASASLAALALSAACSQPPPPPKDETPPPSAEKAAHPTAEELNAGHAGHDMANMPTTGTPAPTTAKSVQFLWPFPGSTVFSEFDVVFGVTGMGLRKAGEDVNDKTTGHHHIIVDSPSIPAGTAVPKDDKHFHYGDAATTAHLTLPVGEHDLEMQLADGAHLSYGPELATKMKVIVKEKPAKIGVSFANLKDGATVKSPVEVKFGVEGFTLRPAGEDALDHTSGHHHLIVDGAGEPIGTVVPKDATHIHFGKAETSTKLELTPGEHTLTLQLADGAHFSYGPALSTTIKVTVK